jgi:histidinol-phosphate aminotransferase
MSPLDASGGTPFELAHPHLASLHPYVPGRQPSGEGWTKLNTNELPYPPSPRVAAAVMTALYSLPKYPSPNSAELRAALADLHGVEPAQVFVGNGSDEVLSLLVRAFGGPTRKVGQTWPSYSLYPVLAAIQDAPVESHPLGPAGRLPVESIVASTAPIFFLTTPNAPFGYGFEVEALRAAIGGFRGIFVADEAYGDFGDVTAAEWLGEFPRLVVTRTFSKSYGLAGLRVGYALAAPGLVGLLDRLRDSYNVNRLSQAGALAAVRDQAYLREVVGKIRATRRRFSGDLRGLGWEVLPSQTNFVFARPPSDLKIGRSEAAAEAFAALEAERILVRRFPSHPETADGLRITIGTDAEMDRCRDVLAAWARSHREGPPSLAGG